MGLVLDDSGSDFISLDKGYRLYQKLTIIETEGKLQMPLNYKTFVRLRLTEQEIERLDENTVELALPVCEVPSLIPAELEESGLREGVILEIMGRIQNELTLEHLRGRFVPPN